MEKKEDKNSLENVFKKISYSTGFICAKATMLKNNTTILIEKTKGGLVDIGKSFKSGFESIAGGAGDKEEQETEQESKRAKHPSRMAKKARINKKETAKPKAAKVVTFSIAAPEAKEVFLAGDFNQWQLNQKSKMHSEGKVWVKRVKLKPGSYRYRFVVDGCWLQDPNNTRCQENAFGSMDSLLDVEK